MNELQKGMFVTGNVVHGYTEINMSNFDECQYRAYFTAEVDLDINDNEDIHVRAVDISQMNVIYMPDYAWEDYQLKGSDRTQADKGIRDAVMSAVQANKETVLDAYSEFA